MLIETSNPLTDHAKPYKPSKAIEKRAIFPDKSEKSISDAFSEHEFGLKCGYPPDGLLLSEMVSANI